MLSASDTLTLTVVVPISVITFGSILISELVLVMKMGRESPFDYKQLTIVTVFPSGSLSPPREITGLLI